MTQVSLIAIGNELLLGSTLDTNTNYLARELTLLGFAVRGTLTVPDMAHRIEAAVKQELQYSDLVVTTGGLGPTSDDVTRNAISAAFGLSLGQDERAYAKLVAHAEKRQRPLYETGKRQAFFPDGATIFVNDHGTADAFACPKGKLHVVSLPGVPREMYGLFEQVVRPWLLNTFNDLPRREFACLQIFGLSESYIGQCVETLKLEAAYRPRLPIVMVVLDSFNDAERVVSAIGEDYVFSRSSEETLAEVVGRLLKRNELRLAVAESCTGGEIADQVVSAAGASTYFRGGIVAYDNQLKGELLGVEARLMEQHGAVSKEVAESMARGVRERLTADIAVSTTGIAGPEGGSAQKPVGTVWIGLSTADFTQAFCYHLPFERNVFRRVAAHFALDLVRRYLLGYQLEFERK